MHVAKNKNAKGNKKFLMLMVWISFMIPDFDLEMKRYRERK
jgi:hypothetical protein